MRAASVVVATGGKSIPKMGATGYGYRVAEQFGLRVTETRPGLVPLTFAEQELERLKPLAGVAVEGRVAAGRVGFDEAVLFTHRGLSGPAVLQVVELLARGGGDRGGPCAGTATRARSCGRRGRRRGASRPRTALGRMMPERLARASWRPRPGLTGVMAEQSNATIERVAALVQGWRLRPVGTEGYRTAEVTLGGVETDDLDGADDGGQGRCRGCISSARWWT